MHKHHHRSRRQLPWRYLALAIASGLAPAAAAQSAGQQIADGIARSIPAGDYETFGVGEHGLYALNSGALNIADEIHVSTFGQAAAGARSQQGALIDMAGGSINTFGDSADGVYVLTGAKATFGRDAHGAGTLIQTRGVDSAAVRADGIGSLAELTGAVLVTQGSIGALAEYGGSIRLIDARITTSGDSASGAYVRNGAGALDIAGTQITTSGREAHGIMTLGSTTHLRVRDTRIQTTGAFAYGVNLNRVQTAKLDSVTIRTTGAGSAAMWVPEAAEDVAVSNIDFQTIGTWAPGIETLKAQVDVDDGRIATRGDRSYALHAAKTDIQATGIDARNLDIQTSGNEAIGALAESGASIRLVDSQVRTTGTQAFGLAAISGGLVETNNTNVFSDGAATAAAAALGGNVSIRGGTLTSQSGSALYGEEGVFTLKQGARAQGGNGRLLEVNAKDGATVALQLDASRAEGDIVRDPAGSGSSPIEVSLDNRAQWTGGTDAVTSMDIRHAGQWTLTRDSTVGGLALNDGIVDIGDGHTGFRTLTVDGDITGTTGLLRMHALLDIGSAPASQQTDRLLVRGDMLTTGTIVLDVTPTGASKGTLTDSNRNGLVDADEGISLVQIAGHSRADAFALAYGYVAAGPYQYTLHAFGPDTIDPAQNALGGQALQWDYRLGNVYSDEEGGLPDPPGPIDPVDPSVRPKVVPQLPSYIAAPTALFNYGVLLVGTLHERLGEIRQVPARPDENGGEVFVRYLSSQQRYDSSRAFTDFGYDFNQQSNALQLGGSLIAWSGADSAFRAGWALDKGSTRVTPRAVDGGSVAKYQAHGQHVWMTWQHAKGFYVDAVTGGERFNGDVGTSARGGHVARLRARSWTASVETGYPFAMTAHWLFEPQAQVTYQCLGFHTFRDADGLDNRLASSAQTTARLGTRLVYAGSSRITPYARLDIMRTVGGAASVSAYSAAWNTGDSFSAGRVGTSYRLGLGATGTLVSNLALYGQADYRHSTAGHGFSGWAGNLGLRLSF